MTSTVGNALFCALALAWICSLRFSRGSHPASSMPAITAKARIPYRIRRAQDDVDVSLTCPEPGESGDLVLRRLRVSLIRRE